ncbi:MAG: hypothetical protein KC486_21895, partial [Myxococcales bacterium]|nr:hypothetical protein [Myxococcales bacterium]
MFWSLALWLVSPALASAPAASASPEVSAEVGASAKTPSPSAEAARLIEEATRAYKVRDFGTTIERLDRAYQLTGSTDLLYELGDAHARYYELDRNPDHLRQARSFFRAFARRAEAAGSSPRDAWERVSALSKRISTVEAAGPKSAPEPACPRCPPAPRCPE